MSGKIYRYTLEVVDRQVVEMPQDAQILHVARRAGRHLVGGHGLVDEIHLWALVDPQAPSEPRDFRIFGTGHSIPDTEDLEYLGTVQIQDGMLVFHVFECTNTRVVLSGQ